MDLEQFVQIRHFLHQNPEVSEEEKTTSMFVAGKMKEIWPEAELENVGNYGLIFSNKVDQPKKHLAFRCELDALPIQEVNDFEHKSVVPGVGHKCGHDGHMAIMMRLAHLVSLNKHQNIKISLIFQPAEENGKGAKEICEKSSLFKDQPLDFIFALHNVPGYKKGAVVLRSGIFTPAVISVKTKFIGKTSHAAEPHKGINPAHTLAEVIQETKAKEVNQPERDDMLIVAVVEANLGKPSYGTSAGDGMIGFTFRTWGNNRLEEFKSWYESMVVEKCKHAGLKCEFFWFESFNSVINDPESTNMIEKSARENKLPIINKEEPFSWGEDYGLYTEKVQGAMFGLGAGEQHPALHNPDYDFPDELIKTGSDIFYGIIKSFES